MKILSLFAATLAAVNLFAATKNATGAAGSPSGGVQLWEGGPYWAECNVGASKPEEYGYYFWWGDTVGYTREGGTYDSGESRYVGVTWMSSAGARMRDSPFDSSRCPTYGKEKSRPRSAGYVDATGNLMAKYDAATAHLGAPWRMPTSAEINALLINCTSTWTTRNGVYGRLVTGRGAFSKKSIFLPAAGYGSESDFCSPGSAGEYWSSTMNVNDLNVDRACGLGFSSSFYGMHHGWYFPGRSVRPVRGSAK